MSCWDFPFLWDSFTSYGREKDRTSKEKSCHGCLIRVVWFYPSYGDMEATELGDDEILLIPLDMYIFICIHIFLARWLGSLVSSHQFYLLIFSCSRNVRVQFGGRDLKLMELHPWMMMMIYWKIYRFQIQRKIKISYVFINFLARDIYVENTRERYMQ